MKRSLLAVAAVLALGSASVYAETPSFPQPSFKDYTDVTPAPAAEARTADRQVQNRTAAQYAHSAAVATRSDAVVDDRATADRAAPNLNDTFHYPTSN